MSVHGIKVNIVAYFPELANMKIQYVILKKTRINEEFRPKIIPSVQNLQLEKSRIKDIGKNLSEFLSTIAESALCGK